MWGVGRGVRLFTCCSIRMKKKKNFRCIFVDRHLDDVNIKCGVTIY